MEPKTTSTALAEYEPASDGARGVRALRDLDFKQMMFVGELMYNAQMFDDLKSAAQAQVKIMAGQELGLAPMQSMNAFYILKGRVQMYANTMAAKVLESGRYRYNVDTMTDELVVINFYRKDGDKWVSVGMSSFSAEDARRAGTQNMGRYPRNMLYARAMSNGVRWYTPDVFSQPVYDEYDSIIDDPMSDDTRTVEEIEAERKDAIKRKREYAAGARDRRVAAKVEKAKTAKDESTKPVERETEETPSTEVAEKNLGNPTEANKPTPVTESTDRDDDGRWSDTEPAAVDPVEDDGEPHTPAQRRKAMALLGEMEFNDAEKKLIYQGLTGLKSFTELTKGQANDLIAKLERAAFDVGGIEGLRAMFIDLSGE